LKIIPSVLVLLLLIGCSKEEKNTEIDLSSLPIQTNFKIDDFTSAKECKECHPSYYKEWSGSMHAYSMTDPVWVASQMSRQTYYADQGIEIGDLCLQCHSPVAYLTGYISDHQNLTAEAIASLPEQIQEGVTCEVCHAVTHIPPPTNIEPQKGKYTDATYYMYLDGTQYGVIKDPMGNDFHASVYHPDYDRSEYCRNCHNLSVNGVDAEVNQFEWEGSAFQAMGVECQTCHMPLYTGQAAEGGPVRENLHRHWFPGLDEALIDFPYRDELKTAVGNLLANSAELNLTDTFPDTLTTGDTLGVDLIVTNNAGHKFPTSVPFVRQLWIELIATVNGDTIFTSGTLNSDGDLNDFHIDPQRLLDPQLKLFNSVLYNAAGDSGLNALSVEEMVRMTDNALPVGGSRIVHYTIPVPTNLTGSWQLTARLRFRAFPPFVLRGAGLEALISEMEIYTIDALSASATVVSG